MTDRVFPSAILNRIGREIRALLITPPTGITYLEDYDEETSFTDIHVHLEGPEGTPYQNTSFHVKLTLPSDFPHSPPNGYFLTRIYHPNVSPTAVSTGPIGNVPGYAICVNTLKRDWHKDVTLSHVLSIIRCLLIVPFPESSLNDEAGKLFMESYDDYAKRATLMASLHAIKKKESNQNKNTVARSRPPVRSSKNSSKQHIQPSPKSQSKETTNNHIKIKERIENDVENPNQEKDKLLDREPANETKQKSSGNETLEKEQHENFHMTKPSSPISVSISQVPLETSSSAATDRNNGTPIRRFVEAQGVESISPHSRGNCHDNNETQIPSIQDVNKNIIQPNDQNNHNNSNTTKLTAYGPLKRKFLSCNEGENGSKNKINYLSTNGKEALYNMEKGKIGYHGEPAPKRLKENQNKKGLKRL